MKERNNKMLDSSHEGVHPQPTESFRKRFERPEGGFGGYAKVVSRESLPSPIPSKEVEALTESGFGAGTVRIQMDGKVTFSTLAANLSEVKKHGNTLYLSPIQDAEGTHGYNVKDPTKLRPDLGTDDDFDKLCEKAKQERMKIILDVVPNHMGAGMVKDNLWLYDALEKGEKSQYYGFFDFRPNEKGKIALPKLGGKPDELWKNGELQVAVDDNGPFIKYWDNKYPINADTFKALNKTPDAFNHTGDDQDGEREKNFKSLMDQQTYELKFWKDGFAEDAEIGYRRFFDINELIALRMEKPEVRQAVFGKLYEFIQKHPDVIVGFRADHPDGMRDPGGFFEGVKQDVAEKNGGKPFVVYGEKIVDGHERYPTEWQSNGETGYAALNAINKLFISTDGLQKLADVHTNYVSPEDKFDAEKISDETKKVTMEVALRADYNYLTKRLTAVAKEVTGRDINAQNLRKALMEVTSHLDRYRTYVQNTDVVYKEDLDALVDAFSKAQANSDSDAFDALSKIAFLDVTDAQKADCVEFVKDWQQYMGATKAVSEENTGFYRSPPLGSRYEVGSGFVPFVPTEDPVEAFHEYNTWIQEHQPFNMVTTSTHDTKRGAETRARMNVISEMPEKWEEKLKEWDRLMQIPADEQGVPVAADRYFMYQTLFAVMPEKAADVNDTFVTRIKEYCLKAFRESKKRTSWIGDQSYEKYVEPFINYAPYNDALIADMNTLLRTVRSYGAVNSLAQEVLAKTIPGVPDTYQNAIGNDTSLVDPDNRTSLDFEKLKQLHQGADQYAHVGTDQLKVYVQEKLQELRQKELPTMIQGEYVPLNATGAHKDNVVAFARKHNNETVITIVPRLSASFDRKTSQGPSLTGSLPLGNRWNDTQIAVAEQGEFEDIFTGERVKIENGTLAVSEVLQRLPISVLKKIA
jgi:(1->4)-alpha-D-glucan 1-alpha-D-glucosylmutase